MQNNVDMGALEQLIASELQDMGRSLLAYAVQKRANNEPLRCPDCRQALKVQKHLRERNVSSQFGPINLSRSYGYCPKNDEPKAKIFRAGIGFIPALFSVLINEAKAILDAR